MKRMFISFLLCITLIIMVVTLSILQEHFRSFDVEMEEAMKEFVNLYKECVRYGANLTAIKHAMVLMQEAQDALSTQQDDTAFKLLKEAIDELKAAKGSFQRGWTILSSDKSPSNNLYPEWWLEGPICEVNIDLYPHRKFKDVTEDIPRLKELGIKTLYLLPIWYGLGYGIFDYFRLNPEYGSPSDLKELVDTAHRNGIRVLFDLVTGNVPFFSYIYQEKPEWLIHTRNTSILNQPEIEVVNRYMALKGNFILSGGNLIGQKLEDDSIILRHMHSEWGWAVDRANLEVIDYFTAVATYYLREYDIDGWRVDAPQNNYNPEIVNEDHSAVKILKRIKTAITQLKPYSILFTEWDSPLSEMVHFRGDDSEPLFDEVAEISYDWPFSGWLRTSGFKSGFLAKVVSNEISSQDLVNYFIEQKILYNRTRARFFNNHDTDRVQRVYPQHHRNLLVLIATVPGVPMIYVGDEMGTDESNKINWENQDRELAEFYEKIFKIRDNSQALKYGSIYNVWTGGDRAYAYLRSYHGDNVVMVLNFQNKPVSGMISLPLEDVGIDKDMDYKVINALSGEAESLKGSALQSLKISLEKNSPLIVLIKKD